MTRSNTLTRSLALVLFAVAIVIAMPVSAWSGHYYGNSHNWDDDRDRNPSCRIEARPNTAYHYGGRVTLSWETTDADWAQITDIGQVSTDDGSITINAYTSKTYYMTVYADGRSAECETFVNVVGEVRSNSNNYSNYYGQSYYQPPYVLLTQIPYTGFDFGPVGNMIYWMTLAFLAIGSAYLLVYQKGMRALASIPVVSEVIRAGRMQLRAVRSITNVSIQPAAASQRAEQTETLAETRFGSDSMKVIEGETPRIVITRD
jgi:hypothetical protein